MSPSPDLGPDPGDRRDSERRRHFTPLRHPERRAGFDRRAESKGGALARSLRAMRDDSTELLVVLVAINGLNVLDLLLTFRLLGAGAVEGNPIMRALIGSDPRVAVLAKLAVVLLVSIAIWRQRRYRMILATSLVILVGFIALTGYELWLVVHP